jgi:hypothetical protein
VRLQPKQSLPSPFLQEVSDAPFIPIQGQFWSHSHLFPSQAGVDKTGVNKTGVDKPGVDKTVELTTCWIAAEHALQHIARRRPRIEAAFGRYEITRSQYAVYAGFDESCIRRGSGYLEQIHIFTLSTILATSPLLTELGSVLSPFSSILFTESSSFQLPVYKDDGTIWDFEELFFATASKHLDRGSTAAMCPTVISVSQTQTTNSKASEPSRVSGSGDKETQGSMGNQEKGKGRDKDNGNGRENPGDAPRDGDHGSGHPNSSGDRDIKEETKETTSSPNVAFEIGSTIYSTTNSNLPTVFQEINTAGELTLWVCSHLLAILKIWI